MTSFNFNHEQVSLDKAYKDFKEQLGFAKEKAVAQIKVLLANGLRTFSYAPDLVADKNRYAAILSKSMKNLAADFERQNAMTNAVIGSTTLFQHVKILGAEVLKELKAKFSTVTPQFTQNPLSPYLADSQKAVRVINHHLRTQFGDEYQLSPQEAEVIGRKYAESKLTPPLNLEEWINETFSDKNSGSQRGPVIRSSLETALPALLGNIDHYEDPGESFDPANSANAVALQKKKLENQLEVQFQRLAPKKEPLTSEEIEKTLLLFAKAHEMKLEHSSDPTTSLGLVFDRFLARDEVKKYLHSHADVKEAFIKMQIAEVTDKPLTVAENFLKTLPNIEENYHYFCDQYASSRSNLVPGNEYRVELEQGPVDLREAFKAQELIRSKLEILKQIRQNPIKVLIEGISDKDVIKKGDPVKLAHGNARDDSKIFQTAVINPIEFPIKQNFNKIFDKILTRYIESKYSGIQKDQLLSKLNSLLKEFQATGDLTKLNDFMSQIRTPVKA